MSKKNRPGFDILITKTVAREEINGIRLSAIRYVQVQELKENPINIEIFKQEGEGYFERLETDIKERGILVPLIASKEGYLLSGHNRLKVAIKLGLQTVPVQYVEEVLTPEQERNFLIKDNLFRRHLNQTEWVKIYEKLYPDFKEWAETERRGRKKKDMSFFSKDSELSAEKIAKDTGQTTEAVKKQLVRMKKDRSETNKVRTQQKPQISTILKKAAITEVSVSFKLSFLQEQNIEKEISKMMVKKGRGEVIVSIGDLLNILNEK